MQVVYADEDPPDSFRKAIFLAGPTPRSPKVVSWRPQALALLEQYGYDGVVFVPEFRDGWKRGAYKERVEWEERGLHMADCILFWIPRNLKTMPAFTTNIEWGVWQNSGKVVLGVPSGAPKVDYQRYYAGKLRIPTADTLEDTVRLAVEFVGDGALRQDGEREVPIHIWRTPHFRQWYAAQKAAGNRLDGARVAWTFLVGPNRDIVFVWALHVNVYVASENRNKTNEVVLGRPDIAAVVMYRKGKTFEDTDIALVREFRSPAATEDGFIWELPSGSSWKTVDYEKIAVAECGEETGLEIDIRRLRHHSIRQLAATFSAHKAHLYSVELTDDEFAFLCAERGEAHGDTGSSERTYVELMKLGEIIAGRKVDWSMLGMVLSVVAPEYYE